MSIAGYISTWALSPQVAARRGQIHALLFIVWDVHVGAFFVPLQTPPVLSARGEIFSLGTMFGAPVNAPIKTLFKAGVACCRSGRPLNSVTDGHKVCLE
jgi:hypothetical protein